jgi:hypothetical protein
MWPSLTLTHGKHLLIIGYLEHLFLIALLRALSLGARRLRSPAAVHLRQIFSHHFSWFRSSIQPPPAQMPFDQLS